ncbi:hypothetical protein HOLleu_27852 [Holothuria leucospilota]|uniref:Uncharacterized protein n=1 Tax=Holothuria leucospilota TaxID=206669 RepID=A0A9Q1H3J0_HOLLE|nr:hypothetical protein HOLleu_27852 [Holothuria leucospilota]
MLVIFNSNAEIYPFHSRLPLLIWLQKNLFNMSDVTLYTFIFIISMMICLARAEELQCARVKCLRYVDCNSTYPTIIPDLTNKQLKVLQDASKETERIVEIIQSSGPIYEGDNIPIPLIEFTPEQEKMLRGFYGQGFLRPQRQVMSQIFRKKRRADRGFPCCSTPTIEARVVLTINEEEELVQVVQLSDVGQFFEDTRQCASQTNGCNSVCRMTKIQVPAIVVSYAKRYRFTVTQLRLMS